MLFDFSCSVGADPTSMRDTIKHRTLEVCQLATHKGTTFSMSGFRLEAFLCQFFFISPNHLPCCFPTSRRMSLLHSQGGILDSSMLTVNKGEACVCKHHKGGCGRGVREHTKYGLGRSCGKQGYDMTLTSPAQQRGGIPLLRRTISAQIYLQCCYAAKRPVVNRRICKCRPRKCLTGLPLFHTNPLPSLHLSIEQAV